MQEGHHVRNSAKEIKDQESLDPKVRDRGNIDREIGAKVESLDLAMAIDLVNSIKLDGNRKIWAETNSRAIKEPVLRENVAAISREKESIGPTGECEVHVAADTDRKSLESQ